MGDVSASAVTQAPKGRIKAQKTPKLKSSKPLKQRIYEHRILYLFVLPAVVWYIVFCYVPMYGALLAFKDYQFNLGILGSPWIGFENFTEFIFSDEFWSAFYNTIIINLLKLLFCFPAPIFLALLLNELTYTKYKRIIQTVSYLPHFVSWVVVVALMMLVFSPYGGMVNNIRQNFGLEPIFFMGERNYFYPLIVFSDIWKGIGWGTIIYLSAITSIGPELYEAAIMDGAGKLKCAWHITLPGISPTIGIMFIFAVGGILGANFDQILLLQQPGNLDLSEVIDTYVLKQGIQQGRFGYSTAVGLFRTIFAAGLMFLANFVSKKLADISIW